ncbi:MAG: menaquinone reductase multiheme cytochrome c subunit QrcA [Pseudomonadota bacterium]
MENQANSPGKPSKRSLLSYLLGFIKKESESPFLPPFSLEGWIFFVGGLIPALIVGWLIFPLALYSKEPQPLHFSHAVHMDPDKVDGIEGDTDLEKCLSCHSFRDDGTFAGIPRLDRCMECHDDPESPMGNDPEEKKFLTEYVANEKQIPWFSYSRQPDCVYFSHIAHVKMGNLDCRTCHGDHAQTDRLRPYEKNRLTGYSRDIWGHNIAGYEENIKIAPKQVKKGEKDYIRTIKTDKGEEKYIIKMTRMKMDDCAECHTAHKKEENNACFVCHK